MKLLLLISILLNLINSSIIENLIGRDLQTASCPRITIRESYSLSYGSSTTILPTYTSSCPGGVTYSLMSVTITNIPTLVSTGTTKALKVQDWT